MAYTKMGGVTTKKCLSIIKNYLLVGEQFDSWPLWYLLGIIYFLLVQLILNKFKVNLKVLIDICIYIFGVIVEILIPLKDNMQGILPKTLNLWQKLFISGRIFLGFGYILAGILLKKYEYKLNIHKILKNNVVLLINLLIFILLGAYCGDIVNYISRLICTIIVLLIALNIDYKTEINLTFRKISTVIYFVHMIFFFLFTLIICKNVNEYGYISFLVSTICSSVLGLLVAKFYDKSKILRTIF